MFIEYWKLILNVVNVLTITDIPSDFPDFQEYQYCSCFKFSPIFLFKAMVIFNIY
jgi:hypothetical protein